MNIILLSGGSGKRLWPLSGDTLSKQFLKLLKNDDGEYESMVSRVMRQIKKAHPDAYTAIACNESQREMFRQHIGETDIIVEPQRRDTYPAVALSAAYLHFMKNLSEDETFVVSPIDTFAQDEYFKLFANTAQPVDTGKYALGLLGTVPTYPSAKYGYILRQDGEVTGFREKPTEQEAEVLIKSGALWNCGVCALKIGYVLETARKYASFDSFESLYEQYNALPKTSYDYEISEKESSIGCTAYEGVWKDLGTWNTLTEEIETASIGEKVLVTEACENTHVLNMLDIPVIAHDLKDIVVVAGKDGILVSSKTGSAHIKPLVEAIE